MHKFFWTKPFWSEIYYFFEVISMLFLQAYAPYERPALTKAYLFPLDKKPARLPVRMIYFILH